MVFSWRRTAHPGPGPFPGDPVRWLTDAQAAFAKGLYTRLFPDADLRVETLKAAHRLADGPRMGYRYMKANLNFAEDAQFEAALDHEALNMGLSTAATAVIYKAMKEKG